MIEVTHLTKSFGAKKAVDDVTFTVSPGSVTGFLGPNGAGKSTTMRMILGLHIPDSGRVLVNGEPFAGSAAPMRTIGALLDGKAFGGGRTARSHLRMLAATHGIAHSRVDAVMEQTGLASVADRRIGGFSLGMGQRLGIAAALLGDPEILVLDEPVNGLDPDGVLWVRTLAKDYAAQGRTVFLSSHLMSEVALTADHVIVIGRGRILADAPLDAFVGAAGGGTVRVRTPMPDELARALEGSAATIHRGVGDLLVVNGVTAAEIGERAASDRVILHELVAEASTLEEAYLKLTSDEVEFHAGEPVTTTEAGS